MTKDKTLKLALAALEIYGSQAPAVHETITAVKEALTQPAPVQEPDIYPEEARELGLEAVAYYTTPPAAQRKPLTDEERNECKQSPSIADQHRAIEIKLKEKNHD